MLKMGAILYEEDSGRGVKVPIRCLHQFIEYLSSHLEEGTLQERMNELFTQTGEWFANYPTSAEWEMHPAATVLVMAELYKATYNEGV